MHIPPLTQNQKLVLSFLASTLGAAVAAGIAAVVQAYTVQGLNVPVLINVGLLAFGAFFGPALYNYVPGHIQQILQASVDTAAMYRNAAQQSQQTHAALAQTVQTLSKVAQAQAVPPVAPLQVTPVQPVANTNVASGVAQVDFSPPINNWMLDKPTATTTAVQPQAPLQGGSQQGYTFTPPVRPTPQPPQPITLPTRKPVEAVSAAPGDVSQQDTQYQSAALPPDLHFGDSGLIPSVGQ